MPELILNGRRCGLMRLCHHEVDGDSEDRFETDWRVLPRRLTASIADRANASFVDRRTVMSPIVPSA
jgi:hypothetical protein